jgi:hypothetical protein
MRLRDHEGATVDLVPFRIGLGWVGLSQDAYRPPVLLLRRGMLRIRTSDCYCQISPITSCICRSSELPSDHGHRRLLPCLTNATAMPMAVPMPVLNVIPQVEGAL